MDRTGAVIGAAREKKMPRLYAAERKDGKISIRSTSPQNENSTSNFFRVDAICSGDWSQKLSHLIPAYINVCHRVKKELGFALNQCYILHKSKWTKHYNQPPIYEAMTQRSLHYTEQFMTLNMQCLRIREAMSKALQSSSEFKITLSAHK